MRAVPIRSGFGRIGESEGRFTVPEWRNIVITGSQRQDLDAQAVARVVIHLARTWLDDGAISPLASREAVAGDSASLPRQLSSHEEDLA